MQEILKQVKTIELTTKHLVDGLMAGKYHSIFKGQGIEFSEIREYVPGDDVRAIDWNVTARFNRPFVKEFIEERDLQVYFAFDASGSGEFGDRVSKKKKAIELAATLMFSALRNNDKVGLLLFTDRVECFIPARKGRRHVLKTLSTILSHSPASKRTDIGCALSYLSRVVKKRGVVFIVSDFLSENFLREMKILKSRQDVIAINMSDPRESEIPDVGMIRLEDEETGEQILLDTSDTAFRERYAKSVRDHNMKLTREFRKLKIDTVNIQTHEPYEMQLRRFFKTRQGRVR